MIKKLKKNKGGFTLEIDETIAEALGITQKTNLDMIVVDDMLIVKPKKRKSLTASKRDAKLNKTTNDLMDKYQSVLKKLAKT